jgi:polyphosphate kinase
MTKTPETDVPKMKEKGVPPELRRLHCELFAMQEWSKAKGAKICVVFEGQDTAFRDIAGGGA